MDFDLKIEEKELTILCSKNLENFAKKFIKYYKNNILRVKEILEIKDKITFIIALTDSESKAGFVYGKSDFSGYFNDTGAFAYINLYGEESENNMFKGLMHELVHHLYKYYLFGSKKNRIVWVDEGLATFLSNQKENLNDEEEYLEFLEQNLINSEITNLNILNHEDRSFGNKNGYNLSYIAIRYLFETNSKQNFLNIIKDENKLLEIGATILNELKKYYKIDNI